MKNPHHLGNGINVTEYYCARRDDEGYGFRETWEDLITDAEGSQQNQEKKLYSANNMVKTNKFKRIRKSNQCNDLL